MHKRRWGRKNRRLKIACIVCGLLTVLLSFLAVNVEGNKQSMEESLVVIAILICTVWASGIFLARNSFK